MVSQVTKEIGFETLQQYRFPNIINVCVIRGDCPCQCIHCPVGRTPTKKRHERFGESYIPLHLFKKIVREMSNYPHSTLRIHGVGEPILWKELSFALEFATDHHVRTWLFTCLVTQSEELLKDLATYSDIIEISVNSIDAKEYKQTKGIDEFSLVKHNIKFLKDFVSSNNLSTRIIVSRVESDNKIYDADFVQYWKATHLLDDCFIRSYHDYNTLLENKLQQERQEPISCLVHWNRFNIDCDGTAVVCFNELFKGKHPEKNLTFGSINTQSVSEIWHCDRLNLIRAAQVEKDYSIVDFTDKLPCINCSSCQPLHGKNSNSENQINCLLHP